MDSQKTLWTIGLSIIVLLIGGLAVFVVIFRPPTPSPTQVPTNTTPNTNSGQHTGSASFPATATSTSGGTSVPAPVMTIMVVDGSPLQVRDFKQSSTTVEHPSAPGHYYIAGGVNPTNNNSPYSILYTESDQSFNITLLAEPLDTVRKNAEAELLQILGVTLYQACTLVYEVSTPRFVNQFYAGKNLGFSFCPGATSL